MPFLLIKNDITKMEVDAIVNAANNTLLGGGGVDGAIHAAAGPELLEECRTLNGCSTGEAKLTKGYLLPAKHVIHTVGPVYQDGTHGEELLLRTAYRSCLSIVEKEGFSTVAFPLISGGVYGYPKSEALRIASEELSRFSEAHEDVTLYMVLYNKRDFEINDDIFQSIDEYLKEDELELRAKKLRFMQEVAGRAKSKPSFSKKKNAATEDSVMVAEEPMDLDLEPVTYQCSAKMPAPAASAPFTGKSGKISLNLDESFQKTLFRLIDERGMSDPECYKRANVDRRHFSKIRSDENYRPSKPTACAFAIALRLTLPETQDFLVKAGFVLSNSLVFDKIIMYCLEHGIYDYIKVNELLFNYDQPLLGA